MSFYDQNHPFGAPTGTPAGVPEAPQVDGLSWADGAYLMRIHKSGFHPPAHMRGMTLAQLEARAREETRDQREAEEARQSAARIANAPKAIERALLDGPSSKRALPPQRGWRLRVRYLNQARRCNTLREAAARVGIDESTARRWRIKFPKFAGRLATIVEERHRQNADELKLRAGEPRLRAVFFRGKQIGEHVVHDDRALMFLLKLEDGQRARAEAREERREQRAHEIRMKELEISKMHASAAHPASPAEAESAAPINDLPAVPADIAPPQIVEAAQPPHPTSPPSEGEESEKRDAHVPLPREEERLGEGECAKTRQIRLEE